MAKKPELCKICIPIQYLAKAPYHHPQSIYAIFFPLFSIHKIIFKSTRNKTIVITRGNVSSIFLNRVYRIPVWLVVVASFTMPAVASSKSYWVESMKPRGFMGINYALRRRNLISRFIITIGVLHVFLPETLHFSSAFICDTGRNRFKLRYQLTCWGHLNGIDRTTVKHKVRELGNVRGIFIIDLVFTSIGSPVRSIPNSTIETHWLGREVPTHCFCFLDLSYGNTVYVKAANQDKNTHKQTRKYQ